MSKISLGFLDRKMLAKSFGHWAQAARKASDAEISVLRRQRNDARALKVHLDKLIHVATQRLGPPLQGAQHFPKPHNTDWAWRPELWQGPLATPGISSVQTKSKMGEEITLFHDCDLAELTMRQLRNLREEDIAPYGLQLDVFEFRGSFLSMVVDLPQEGITGLRQTHLLRMDAIVELEKPLEIFARLNIKHGPNTEQIVRELPLDGENYRVEFDLAYSNLNGKRVERAWIDIIFEGPKMNQIVLRDLTLTRRPRANL
jgi:hypothetical protein